MENLYINDEGKQVYLSKQQAATLNYMDEYGSIKRHQAINDLFIYNLPDVVMKLRNKGFNISTNFPDGKHYGEYRHESTGDNILL